MAAAEASQQRSQKRLQATSEIRHAQSGVVQQAKLLDSAGTAWHAVKYGNLEQITRSFPSQCNVYDKGPVGDNVFHVALLLNTPSTLSIAKYLVKLYGRQLVNTPYQERKYEQDAPGLYEGETALHIAIVNRDFDMVKFLIQAGAEIRARCYGAFFDLSSPVYYGEYPLSFAAATGQKDIVSYLKRHGARVNQDTDMYGNTAQHLAVWHDQLDMYDHLVEYCGAAEHVRNNRGATPLLLAATLGKLEVFQHIYNTRRKVAWAYGPVTSYSLSLHEIDSVQNSHRTFVPSAIETIVRKGHMHMIDDPLVKTLLTNKWQRFARPQFLLQGGIYLALMLLQTFLVWLHSDSNRFNSWNRTGLEISSILLALGFLVLEVVDVCTWTLGVFHRRQLMKANLAYCPPLYPIPGEVAEVHTKVKGGFLTRIMKGAVAEGCNTEPYPGARPSTGAQADGSVAPTTYGSRVQVPDAGPPGGSGWWTPAYAQGSAGSCDSTEAEAGGPVAEGTPGLDSDGRGSRPSSRPSSRSGVKFSQAIGTAPDIDDLGMSTDPRTMASGAYRKQHSQHAARLSKPGSIILGGPGEPPVDIVSVGIGNTMGTSTMIRSPSFFVQPSVASRGGAAEGSMHGGGSLAPASSTPPGAQLPPTIEHAPPHSPSQPAARQSSEEALGDGSGAARVRDSMDSTRTSTEIRNRIRGGGGGDYQAGASLTRRPEAKSQAVEKEESVEDVRQPLHLGGFRGQSNTLIHSLAGYYTRQAQDPITLLMLCHILLTITHFITWATCYGGTGGTGPSSENVREFDDIILSLVVLTGWISLLYFARGVEFAGQLAVLVEMCCLDVVKYLCIYFVFNMGYTLAFYTVLRGTTDVMAGGSQDTPNGEPDLNNIGYTMIQLLRFMYGEAAYESYSATSYRAKKAVATCYFILYIATVLLLLTNLLTAIILHTYNARQGHAQKVWLLRWASYVLRAEARMPLRYQQRFRLGEVSYDPALGARVYNHVFEVVEGVEDKAEELSKETRALEAALERIKKAAGPTKK